MERVPEVVEGYPKRIIAKPEYAELKKRNLTSRYNALPAWLDKAVAEAYGRSTRQKWSRRKYCTACLRSTWSAAGRSE